MKIIYIINEKYGTKECFVDDEDYEELNKNKWYLSSLASGNNTFYAQRTGDNGASRTTIRMHRQIMNLKSGNKAVIDHIDHNGLNNQKSNLRLCTISQNGRNRQVDSPGSASQSSKYKGVSWFRRKKRWTATIKINKKKIHLGYFINENEAASVYNKAAAEHFGEFACLNVIKEELYGPVSGT